MGCDGVIRATGVFRDFDRSAATPGADGCRLAYRGPSTACLLREAKLALRSG